MTVGKIGNTAWGLKVSWSLFVDGRNLFSSNAFKAVRRETIFLEAKKKIHKGLKISRENDEKPQKISTDSEKI